MPTARPGYQNGSDSFTDTAASCGSFSAMERGSNNNTRFMHASSSLGTTQAYAQGAHAPGGDSLASYLGTGSSVQTTTDYVGGNTATLAVGTSWTLSGIGTAGTYQSQSLSTYTQPGSTETSAYGTTLFNQMWPEPQTTFTDGAGQQWAPLGTPYGWRSLGRRRWE